MATVTHQPAWKGRSIDMHLTLWSIGLSPTVWFWNAPPESNDEFDVSALVESERERQLLGELTEHMAVTG